MSLRQSGDDRSKFPPKELTTEQLQTLGERELWASAMVAWLKWPHLSYDGKIRMSLLRM